MENENLKLKPYDRLQSIFSEKNSGKLTENAADKLDYLLSSKNEVDGKIEIGIFQKIIQSISNFFQKIDGKIFSPKSKKFNTTFQRRKKDKNKWT